MWSHKALPCFQEGPKADSLRGVPNTAFAHSQVLKTPHLQWVLWCPLKHGDAIFNYRIKHLWWLQLQSWDEMTWFNKRRHFLRLILHNNAEMCMFSQHCWNKVNSDSDISTSRKKNVKPQSPHPALSLQITSRDHHLFICAKFAHI